LASLSSYRFFFIKSDILLTKIQHCIGFFYLYYSPASNLAMKTILIGAIAFLIWSGSSSYLYVCKIKGLCPEEKVVTETIAESQVKQPEIQPEIAEEPAPALVSPGSFTLYHSFNQQKTNENNDLAAYLKELKNYITQKEDAKVNITGHTDGIGTEQYNYELGLHRAEYVEDILVQSAIPSENISVNSKGETQSVASNATGAGRAKNRRTEIEVK
jgi:outer membrane protein OmpA-like peptidoglycan-associated protein